MLISETLETKLKLFQATCLSILLYGCESLVLTKDMKMSINSFATSCYRILLNIKRIDRSPNAELYDRVQTQPLVSIVMKRQLTFLGHHLRMDPTEPAQIYGLYSPTPGKRRPCRQRLDYLKYIQECLGDHLGMLTTHQTGKLTQF